MSLRVCRYSLRRQRYTMFFAVAATMADARDAAMLLPLPRHGARKRAR